MLALFLDETGQFELSTENVRANVGLLYRGENVRKALEILEKKLKLTAWQLGINYPEGLHAVGISSQVKKKLRNSLLDCLAQDKGWVIIGIIDNGMRQEQGTNITNESQASNLYFNMLMRLIENVLFYSPMGKQESKVELYIASRVFPVKDSDQEKQQQFEQLGFRFIRQKGQKIYFVLDKGMLTAALNRCCDVRRDYSCLSFESIHVGKIYAKEETNGGMLTSDIIANWLYGKLKHSKDQGIEKIECKIPIYFWAYDLADEYWRQRIDAVRQKDLFGYFSLEYQAKNSGSTVFTKYYQEKWPLPEPEVTDQSLSKCVEELNQMIKNNHEFAKHQYILERIIHLVERKIDWAACDCKTEGEKLYNIYLLNDLLMRNYNHYGNVSQALFYQEKAQAILSRLPRQLDYLLAGWENVNRTSLGYSNRFDFGGAINLIMEGAIVPLERLLTAYGEGIKEVALGRFYSSAGRNYAFLGRYDQALGCFQKALENFEGDSGNQAITTSHLLHLAIAKEDYQIWEKYSHIYLPRGDYRGIFSQLLQNKEPFKFLIWIKGLNMLPEYSSIRTDQKLLEDLIQKDYDQIFGWKTAPSHPRELIYRHLAELAYINKETQLGEQFIRKALSEKNSGNLTLRLMDLGTLAVAVYYEADSEKQVKELAKIFQQVKELGNWPEGKKIYNQDDEDSWFHSVLKEEIRPEKVRELARQFIKKFTYAYR